MKATVTVGQLWMQLCDAKVTKADSADQDAWAIYCAHWLSLMAPHTLIFARLQLQTFPSHSTHTTWANASTCMALVLTCVEDIKLLSLTLASLQNTSYWLLDSAIPVFDYPQQRPQTEVNIIPLKPATSQGLPISVNTPPNYLTRKPRYTSFLLLPTYVESITDS